MRTRCATVDGRSVDLTAREFALFCHFCEWRGKVLSRGTQQIGKACEPIRRVLPADLTKAAAPFEVDTIVFVEVDVDTTAYEQSHIPGAVGWNWTSQLADGIRRDIATREIFQVCTEMGLGVGGGNMVYLDLGDDVLANNASIVMNIAHQPTELEPDA